MRYSHRPSSGQVLQVRRSLLPLFLFLTVVFFFYGHNLSNAARAMGDYDRSAEYLVTMAAQGSPSHRIALLLLAVFAVVSLFRNWQAVRLRLASPLGWILLAFVAWTFLSSIWAQDTLFTVRRLMTFGVLCIASLALARRLSLREFVLWVFFSTSAFLIVGVVADMAYGTFQPFTSGYRFAGTLLPNGEGIECGLLLLSAVAAADMNRRRRLFFWACGLLGFVFLILTGSRTSLASTVLALVVYFSAVFSRRRKIVAVFGVAIAFLVLLPFLVNGSSSTLENAVLFGRNDPVSVDSFTGRTWIWAELMPYIGQRPILGYGYGGFWTPAHIAKISDDLDWACPDGHSAYLDCLLALGGVGLAAYVLLLLGGIKRALHCRGLSGNPAFAFCAAILVFSVVDGFSESAAIEGSFLTFVCMVVFVQLALMPLRIPRKNLETLPRTDRASMALASSQ